MQNKRNTRLIGLSATPGNNIGKIQEVINSLCVSKFEAKDEEDDEVKPYLYSKCVREEIIHETSGIHALDDMLRMVIKHTSAQACSKEALIRPVKALIQKIAKLACEDVKAMYQKLIEYQETFIKRLPNGK